MKGSKRHKIEKNYPRASGSDCRSGFSLAGGKTMKPNFAGHSCRIFFRRPVRTANSGVMFLEVMIVIATMAVSLYVSYTERVRAAASLANRETINKEIILYLSGNDKYPESLSEVGWPD